MDARDYLLPSQLVEVTSPFCRQRRQVRVQVTRHLSLQLGTWKTSLSFRPHSNKDSSLRASSDDCREHVV